ncbi:pumilio domain-containing-like protein [Encephalitozoon cuniculi]|nr:pumilio domain-containing-like protein [Encephalitozoon cuniculi]
MQMRYKLVLARKDARIEDRVLKGFVQDVMRSFGGLDLLSRVDVRCSGGVIAIETDSKTSHVVHGSLFFCGEYKSIGCVFERVD